MDIISRAVLDEFMSNRDLPKFGNWQSYMQPNLACHPLIDQRSSPRAASLDVISIPVLASTKKWPRHPLLAPPDDLDDPNGHIGIHRRSASGQFPRECLL